MSQTLVAIFDTYSAANRAVEQLVADGFERSSIDVKAGDTTGSTTTGTTTTRRTQEDEGVFESIGNFFSDLFGADNDRDSASHYSEAVRRGHAVLTLRVDDDAKVDTAHTYLMDAGALDVDEQVSTWRGQGYTGAVTGSAASASTSTSTTTSASKSMSASGSSSAKLDAKADREGVIPVVQEELEVGKRRVEQGRVRVVSHVETKPVHESVELQSERAVIERHAVDRPASEADLAGFEDRTIEVRESAEKAVVSKTAHVVEEVVVGKQVSSETKEIDDTVRRTDVSIEREAGDAKASEVYDTHRAGFLSDFKSKYASKGETFEAYEPAYRSGFSMRDDPRYKGKDWDAVEPSARAEWEKSNPGTWDRMREAHRRGWDWERS